MAFGCYCDYDCEIMINYANHVSHVDHVTCAMDAFCAEQFFYTVLYWQRRVSKLQEIHKRVQPLCLGVKWWTVGSPWPMTLVAPAQPPHGPDLS